MLNVVVISAAISAINSDIFGAGRMMYGLAQQGHAPRSFGKLSKHGVPWMTVVVMGAALLIGVLLNYLIPENVFLLIASIATFATVWVWLMILLTQVAMRRSMSVKKWPSSSSRYPSGLMAQPWPLRSWCSSLACSATSRIPRRH